MSISESIYGVTMEEPGVSRLISMKIDRPDAN
jgi:chromosome segregation ATPase